MEDRREGRHQAEDIGDPIWCVEDCVYVVHKCVL